MNKGEKYVLWAREEILYPLNSVVKASDLLCQWYIGYWHCVIDTQPQEEEAEDIPIVVNL